METEKGARGGARDGAGRPVVGDGRRDRNIGIRVSESELAMFREKADKAGMTLTELIISLVKDA